MGTITIPQKITKGEELVIVPRKEYEKLLSYIRRKKKLDKDLEEALEEVRNGKTIGPFSTLKEGLRVLKNNRPE